MKNIKVSVIVPVFNTSQYISKTLDSIISQDFENFELIVIDDGSTDNSLEIINNKLKNCNIPHKIIHQENAGVSVARNRGIDESIGDELYNGKTDFSMIQFVKKDGDKLSNPHVYSKDIISTDEFIKMELNMQIPFNFFQLIYKADIIKDNNIRFTPGVVYGEDTEFALKTLSFGDKIAISNEVTYFYVQHSQSAIKTSEFKRFGVVNVFENLADFYKNNGRDDLANLITVSRIPKAIFGNMNFFFYNGYDFDEVINEMEELDLFSKLSKFQGDKKFKLKIKLFLFSPKIYYKVWKKLKKSID